MNIALTSEREIERVIYEVIKVNTEIRRNHNIKILTDKRERNKHITLFTILFGGQNICVRDERYLKER